MSFLSSLHLSHYRSYERLVLDPLPSGFLVFFGANGAGKTNILDAVSMLSPGRGLRGVKSEQMQRRGSSQAWAVSACVENSHSAVQIGSGHDFKTGKRVVRIQGQSVRGQKALAEHLSCLWLTPQMDRIFLDSAGHRRRFLDRLIFAFDPGHLGRITRYENAMRQRSRLLQGGKYRGVRADAAKSDPAWLSGLEVQMAEIAVAIAAARLDFIERLQNMCDQFETVYFLRARLHASGTLEGLLAQGGSALEVEGLFKAQLFESRGVDMLTGGASVGPHKSDFVVRYAAKDMAAAQCSTGEQKMLLIGIILAHARLVQEERGAPPLLLLDEVAAHLDADRRGALYELLGDLGGQVWLTGTDRSLFSSLESAGRSQFFEVADGGVHAA